MTNHDFWMSISDIINGGFTSEGLAKLDDYAEQFSTGKHYCPIKKGNSIFETVEL